MSSPLRFDSRWFWIVLTLAAQTAWGAFPVFARYLQTVSDLPSMSIIGAGNLVAFVIMGTIFLPRLRGRQLNWGVLITFAVIVVGRGLSNFLAARFTLAIYVQLLTQMTPFLVAIISLLLFGEKLPRYTGRAIVLCALGAALMVGAGNGLTGGFSQLERSDWLGIGLASVSSLLLAIYMLAIRHSAQQQVPGEALLITQLVTLSLAGFTLSLISGEDWAQWGQLLPQDWFVLAGLILGVYCGANSTQIAAIRHLGAPMVSSTIAWRLVSALVLGSWLLDERLTSTLQTVGAILVLLTITLYLWQQRHPEELAVPQAPQA